MINNEVKNRVRNILETNKEARDCDRTLIAIIWEKEFANLYGNPRNYDVIDFLTELIDGDLTSPETIRRCRQKLQQENESLRGLKYKQRKQLGEEVRQSISK